MRREIDIWRISSISNFLELLEKLQFQFGQSQRGSSFIFRGMANTDWSLLPSIFREERRFIDENEILHHFRKESSGLLPNMKSCDSFTWLQYAQHYGVPTRLLDFTENPLCALYFSCISNDEKDGCLWILNVHSYHRWTISVAESNLERVSYTKNDFIKSILDSEVRGCEVREEIKRFIEKPIFFIPEYIDQRMSAQSSRFLLWGTKGVSLEEMMQPEHFMKVSSDGVRFEIANDERFILKVEISTSCKNDIIQQLDILGINEKTLFPGLDSIGRYIGKRYRYNRDIHSDYL